MFNSILVLFAKRIDYKYIASWRKIKIPEYNFCKNYSTYLITSILRGLGAGSSSG